MATTDVGTLYDDYKKGQPTVVPAGHYKIEVIKTSVRNENRVLITGKVIGGPCDGQLVFLPGQSLTEGSAGIFFQTFANFGLDEGFFTPLRQSSFGEVCEAVADALVGVVIEADLIEDEYRGKAKNEYAGIGAQTFVGRKDSAGVFQAAAPSPASSPGTPAQEPQAAPPPPAAPAAAPAPQVAPAAPPAPAQPPAAPPATAPAAPPVPPQQPPAAPPAAPEQAQPAAPPAAPQTGEQRPPF